MIAKSTYNLMLFYLKFKNCDMYSVTTLIIILFLTLSFDLGFAEYWHLLFIEKLN